MNWDQIEGNWLVFKGKLRHNWAKLTDEDITRINGRREELVARLQERYGFARPRPSGRSELGSDRRGSPPRRAMSL
jgi:uncharacterized protein YjbJ (UPF0337 family)